MLVERLIALPSWEDVRKRAQMKKAGSIKSIRPLILMRRRPTLPHTFARSTIGPVGLNFRVRDGNGWNPHGKITANLAIGPDDSDGFDICDARH
jgi:hypothetical protein